MTKSNSALVERAEYTLATGVAPDWDEFLEIQGIVSLWQVLVRELEALVKRS